MDLRPCPRQAPLLFSVPEHTGRTLTCLKEQYGRACFLVGAPTSDDQLAEYRDVPDAYFGTIVPKMKHAKDAFELFEWLMEVNAKMARQKMLDWFGKDRPDRAELEAMNDDDLCIAYCEAHVAAVVNKPAKAAAQ